MAVREEVGVSGGRGEEEGVEVACKEVAEEEVDEVFSERRSKGSGGETEAVEGKEKRRLIRWKRKGGRGTGSGGDVG